VTLNHARSKLLTLHYIVNRVMPYVATCYLVLWYMVWNGNSIGQIHVPQNIFLVIIIRPHRSTTYIDAAYCYRVARSVCLSVTLVSPTKTAEPIEMPFWPWTRMGTRNHVLDAGPEVLREVTMATNFWLSMGAYNFGRMIASDTLFDSRGGFPGSSYPIKI